MNKGWMARMCRWMMLGVALVVPFFSVHASAWVDDGWTHVEQNQPDQALQTWQQGVNQLEDKQPLIVLSVVDDAAAVAIDLAQKVNEAVNKAASQTAEKSVFVVQSLSRGKPIYYVLSLQTVSSNPSVRYQQLAVVRKALGVNTKLFSDAAKVFKLVVGESVSLVAPSVLPEVAVASVGKAIQQALIKPTLNVADVPEHDQPSKASENKVEPLPAAADAMKNNVVPEVVALSPLRANIEIDFRQIDTDYDIGRFEEALWALEDLQKVYPNNADVLYRMGQLQEEMFDFEAAIQAYQQSVVNNLAAPSLAYARLAELYNKKGQYSQAITVFEQLIKLKPGDAYSWYMLGMVYMNTGEFTESISALKHAAEVDGPYRQNSLYGQGIAYLRMNDAENAEALFKACIALNPTSDVAVLAEKGVADAIVLANTSYFSLFSLYGFQYDSNVVLKPSTSPNVPLITGVKDFEHTLLSVLSYAPPPASNGMGYKASAMVYGNIHVRLTTFDIVALDFTITPYMALNKSNVLSMDASFGYIFFNYNRYMDTIKLKPSLTYSYSDQLQFMVSLAANRANYYQPVLLQTSLQDGWTLTEDVKVTLSSKDHKSSFQLGGSFVTNRTRGSDWSYNSFGGNAAVNVPAPYVDNLALGLNGSIERQKFQNVTAGSTQKRRDTIYNGSASISYPFTYVNVSLTGNYTHSVSSTDVFSYVRMMAGFNISRSF